MKNAVMPARAVSGRSVPRAHDPRRVVVKASPHADGCAVLERVPRCSEAGEQPTRESTNVDDAIEMSFPASDPPSWGGGIARVSPSEAPRHQSGGLEHLLQRIRAEYREMPGLSLTLRQAQRLWRLERRTCEALFRALTDARFLHRTDRGRFVLRQSLV